MSSSQVSKISLLQFNLISILGNPFLDSTYIWNILLLSYLPWNYLLSTIITTNLQHFGMVIFTVFYLQFLTIFSAKACLPFFVISHAFKKCHERLGIQRFQGILTATFYLYFLNHAVFLNILKLQFDFLWYLCSRDRWLMLYRYFYDHPRTLNLKITIPV